MKHLYGPDVSLYQGDIDWDRVARAGNSFAFCKATEGKDYTDPRFTPGRVAAMRRAGLVRGFYHFARPQPGRAPAIEVRHFVNTVREMGGLKPGDLPGVLDIESASGLRPTQITNWVREWVVAYKSQTGHLPIIYTGSFWRYQMANPPDNFGCRLWLAAYVKDPSPYVPRAWRNYRFWQYTDSAWVPGISGPCDRSVFRGGHWRLKRICIK